MSSGFQWDHAEGEGESRNTLRHSLRIMRHHFYCILLIKTGHGVPPESGKEKVTLSVEGESSEEEVKRLPSLTHRKGQPCQVCSSQVNWLDLEVRLVNAPEMEGLPLHLFQQSL